MKTLLIATQNPGKVKEIQKELGNLFECVSKPIEEVVEDGGSYKANVTKKAKAYFEKYQIPVLADDSGIEIEALNGDPGVESAYFGGNISWSARLRYTLDRVKDFPKPWEAKFRCLLCYYDGKDLKYFEGECEGEIASMPKGENGFGFDPIFYSYDLRKTFGEATDLEKGQVSHRSRAIEKFRQFLQHI